MIAGQGMHPGANKQSRTPRENCRHRTYAQIQRLIIESMRKLDNPHDPLPVEATFDRFIELVGGRRVSSIVGQAPAFANADYVFAEKQFVLELKELTTDWPLLEDYQQKINGLWLKLAKDGRVSALHFTGELQLPRDVRREFLQILRKPVKRILEKANRQIRETHVNLGHRSGEGLLLLVIDGLRSVAPQFLIALIAKILLHDYSSIKGIVLITVNEYIDIPGDDFARLVWIPSYDEQATDDLVDFVDDLGRKWFNFIDKEIGGFDDRSEGPDNAWLEGAHFVRR